MQPLQPGGGFEVALHDGDFFSNSKTDDLNIRSMLDTQRIHIGTNSNRESSMMITSNTVFLNHDLFINRHLAVGKSNMIDDYPVDILGNAAIDGSINSTKYVLCRGLQLRRKIGGYYDTVDLPTGLLQGFSNDDYGIVIYTHGGSECNYFKFMASNIDIFHIEGSGNVGIGYSNPQNKLDVAGAIYASNGIIIGSNYLWNNPNNLLISTTSNTSNLVIARPTGRIGINTTNPAVILDIIATDAIRVPTGTSAQRPSAPQSGYIRYNTTTNSFEGYGGTAWGSIGGLKDTNQDTYITMESTPTANDDTIRFYTSNNEILKILPSGFIGVSNANPSERLELSGGNARFNSNVYVMTRLGISNTTPSEALDVIGNISSSSNVYAMQRLGVRTKTPSEVVEIVGNTKITNNAYVMNWLSVGTSNATTQFEVNGSAKIGQDLEVMGNMTIRGTTTSVDTQTVTIKDNIIQLNSGVTYNANLNAGIEINRGTGYSNFNILYDEPSDYLKIGFSGSTLQTVATREDNPPNMTIPYYDSSRFMYGSCNLFVYNNTTGRLGIGASNPDYRLHVVQNEGPSSNATIYMISPSNSQFNDSFMSLHTRLGQGMYNPLVQVQDIGIIFSASRVNQNTGNLVIAPWSPNNYGIKILGSNGNVGIGKYNPIYTLDVNGTVGVSNFIQFSNVDAGKRIVMWDNGVGGYNGMGKDGSSTTLAISSTNDHFKFVAYSSGTANEVARITGTGNLTASGPLHTLGSTSVGTELNILDIAGAAWKVSTANSRLDFQNNNGGSYGTKMCITSAGSLGIGINIPSYRLHVTGGTAYFPDGLICPGLNAQHIVNGGGDVTWSSTYNLLWTSRVIVIPGEKAQYLNQGYCDIFCPTSGTITYYNYSNSANVTTTVNCTANGIQFPTDWVALYYEITPGQGNSSDQTKFRLVHYLNSSWRPTSNWILLAVVNIDCASCLKWIPGNVVIRLGGTYYSSTGTNNWQIQGTSGYIAKFTGNNTIGNLTTSGNSVIYDNGTNVGIGTTGPAYKLDVNGDMIVSNWIRTRGNNGWYSETWGGGWYMSDVTWIRATGSKNVWTEGSICCNGNIGVGNYSPAYKLDVTGDIRSTGEMYCANGVAVYGVNPGDLISKSYGSGDRYGIGQYNSGTTRIFCSSTYSLGSVRISKPTNDDLTGTGTFIDMVTVAYDGKMGIGTTSPHSLLHSFGGELRVQRDVDQSVTITGPFLSLVNKKNGGGGSGTLARTNTEMGINFISSTEWDTESSSADNIMASIKFILDSGQHYPTYPGRNTGRIGFFTTTDGSSQFSEKMTITKAGNVGIGVTSPASRLQVPSSGTTTGLSIQNADVHMILGNYANNNNAGTIQVKSGGSSSSVGSGNYSILLNPDGGNVGIGTTAPGYKLDVNGDIIANIFRSRGANNGWYHETYGGGWFMNESTWIRAYNNKNVYTAGNIQCDGTLTGGTISGNGASITNLNAANVSSGTLPVARGGTGTTTSTGSGSVVLSTNPILSGNVGIGTTIPAYKLDVNGDLISTYWLRTRGNYGWYSETHGGGWQMIDSVWIRAVGDKNIYTGGDIRCQGSFVANGNITTGGASLIFTNYSGASALGIRADGTTYISSVSANIASTGDNTALPSLSANSRPLHIFASNIIYEARYGIHQFSSGNVGIGTDIPASKLHVHGGDIVISKQTTGNNIPGLHGSIVWYSLARTNGYNNSSAKIICGYDKNYFEDTGYLAFATSQGTDDSIERMRITANGDVGIKTSIPSTPLHVYCGESARGIIQENCNAWDDGSKVYLGTKVYSTLMPMMWSTNLYIYATSATANVYYRWAVEITTYFTGQHAGVPDDKDIKDNITDYVGLIVSSADTGYVSYSPTQERITGEDAIAINECLPNITLSTIDNDPAVFGVISDRKDNCSTNTDGSIETDANPTFENDLRDRVRVNSIGEGAIWVSNINGNLRNGDYITSSIIPGIGKRQDDDILHNYTVAKITMSCNFELNTGRYKCVEFDYNGQTYRKAFVGCTYHCG